MAFGIRRQYPLREWIGCSLQAEANCLCPRIIVSAFLSTIEARLEVPNILFLLPLGYLKAGTAGMSDDENADESARSL